ncbi:MULTISPECIES: DUF2804 domain-containing protein [unclassified Acinetobacter]|uniref:DUF2804 domain-containing protein n=1 Tax=unclassified Acinetobacter TaxID=196816 RepID=UPI0035B9B22B
MKKRFKLQRLEQLIQNGKPHFGVFEYVKDINYLDYHSHRVSQKPLSRLTKWLAANQFAFVQILVGQYQVCVAVATVKYATTAFCYIYYHDTQKIQLIEKLAPLTLNCGFNQSPYQGKIYFQNKQLDIQFEFLENAYHIEIQCKDLSLSAKVERCFAPLAVCSMAGRYGWVFTQKEASNKVQGHMSLHSQSIDLSASQARASLDWSLGYMRSMTNWFWTSINASLPDGRHFAMNLATGVNESGTSENVCWLDGEIYYLPTVLYQRPHKNDTDQRWKIYHQQLNYCNVSIELYFQPITCYQKNDRFIIVDSIFEQWIGMYSGHIVVDGEQIVLHDILGLAEDHYAKW